MTSFLIFLILSMTSMGYAAPSRSNDFMVNCCKVENAPSWITSTDLGNIASDVQNEMHWIIRRIKVIFHSSDQSFAAASKLNFRANAFFSPSTQTVQIAPLPDLATFTPTFRHELVHVIFNQKFKTSIPAWLEEGLANYLGSKRQVDYKWLKTQQIPNAKDLAHPSKDSSGSKMHYQLSTATAEMIASRCNLRDLMMLATGAKLANYLETFCKIKDLNNDVRAWIKTKS